MNKALTSDRKIMDHCRPIALAQYKLLTLALVAAGYEATRFKVLEPSCDFSLPELEERKKEWVELYLNALGVGVDLTTFPDVNSCENLSAANAERAGGYASLVTALTGANNDLYFRAKQWGPIGNTYAVRYNTAAGVSDPLEVVVVGTTIDVQLSTYGASVVNATASQIKAAIEAHPAANSLVEVNLVAGNTGAGVVEVMAATNLDGGY